MAGRGSTTPKDPANRRRTNSDGKQRQTVTEDGELRGDDLPFGINWPDQTRIWWDNWRRSPQAQRFIRTDWDFLLDTAMIHAKFWLGDASVAGELRLRVSKLGATGEDRSRLLMVVDEPEQAAPVKPIKPRRLKAV